MDRSRPIVRSSSPLRLVPIAIVAASVALVSMWGVAGAPRAGAAPTCWWPPVDGTVVDPFRAPDCRWCAGNRGLEYRVGRSAEVSAAASGRVEFAGAVVDVRYVVVRLANGWRHTYGQLGSTSLSVGDVVLAGMQVGRVSERFFFSVRVGDDYVDPAPFIGELRTRPRLIPTDRTPARHAPVARPRCAGPAPTTRAAPQLAPEHRMGWIAPVGPT